MGIEDQKKQAINRSSFASALFDVIDGESEFDQRRRLGPVLERLRNEAIDGGNFDREKIAGFAGVLNSYHFFERTTVSPLHVIMTGRLVVIADQIADPEALKLISHDIVGRLQSVYPRSFSTQVLLDPEKENAMLQMVYNERPNLRRRTT